MLNHKVTPAIQVSKELDAVSDYVDSKTENLGASRSIPNRR